MLSLRLGALAGPVAQPSSKFGAALYSPMNISFALLCLLRDEHQFSFCCFCVFVFFLILVFFSSPSKLAPLLASFCFSKTSFFSLEIMPRRSNDIVVAASFSNAVLHFWLHPVYCTRSPCILEFRRGILARCRGELDGIFEAAAGAESCVPSHVHPNGVVSLNCTTEGSDFE